ncbi:MAG: CcmD family protein [Sphingobacteriia bacterium]|jgi:hypothetical protein
MKQIKKYILLAVALFLSNLIQAQTTPDAGIMRSNGKILVVMGVVVIIMVGLFIYLLNIDLKITRLEKGEDRK